MKAGPRFSIIPAGAVTDLSLEPRDLQVLCLLGRHIDDAGWCSRSQVKMARELGCGRATVQRALERLVVAGWVEVRPETRSDGGDRAHSYRVAIDGAGHGGSVAPADGWSGPSGDDDAPQPEVATAESAPESPEGGGAHQWAGVPMDGQGVPAQDGQGVPTHERAPIRTTPVNDPLVNGEREAGARAPESAGPQPAAAADRAAEADWVALCRAWPTAAADDLRAARRAFDQLPRDEQREALAKVPDFLAWLAGLPRRHPPSLPTYLADRRWQLLQDRPKPADPPPKPVTPGILPPFSRGWWWELFRRLGDRAYTPISINGSIRAALQGAVGLAAPTPPTDEQEAAMVRLHRDSAEFRAWVDHVAGFGVRLARPDVAEFVWAPAQWPPGKGEAVA